MKVLSVVGNRPQFIKSAPLSVALRERGLEEVVVHTGQHYDRALSEVFFDELGLAEPDYPLDLQTADPDAMEPAIAAAIDVERPDWVLVYGDTNSTLAGARAGDRAGVPVAHVEAGLRSGDLDMPEERNRIEVDRISELLLAPDERSREILLAEGATGTVVVVGDVIAIDPMGVSSLLVGDAVESVHDVVRRGDGLVDAPGVRERIRAQGEVRGLDLPHLQVPRRLPLVEPLGYLDLAALASQARVVLTDSGGLQKEAYWYGVPCVTLRPSTEWVDTVELGANTLVDDDPDRLVSAVAAARMPAGLPQLYGDGKASERIAEALYTLRRS